MARARAGMGLAVLAWLAACQRAPDPVAQPAADATASPATLRPPVAASPEPLTTASPLPEVSESPSPAAPPAAEIASYPPRTECAKLPGFSAFRDKVFAAAKVRDSAALAALADPAIHLDFGGGAGTEELKKRLDDPKSGLWGEIDALAGLGCAADKSVATLPWIFARVPETADPYRTMLVTGAKVPLRGKPSASAPAKATLDWALVTLAGTSFDPKAPFSEVAAADGARGFVETAKLRSILDYRLIADRQDGEWTITALIAGD